MQTAIPQIAEPAHFNDSKDVFCFYPQRASILNDESLMEKSEDIQINPNHFICSTSLMNHENNDRLEPIYVSTPGTVGYTTRETHKVKKNKSNKLIPDDYILHAPTCKSQTPLQQETKNHKQKT